MRFNLPQGHGEEKKMYEVGKRVFFYRGGPMDFSCASCHGENAKGMVDTGAPDLTDKFWIYGGDAGSVYTTVYAGRQGHMPHWDGKLTPVAQKILALYVATLEPAHD